VLELLAKRFVNAWILHKDLVVLAADEAVDADLRAAARTALERIKKHRLSPVGIQVVAPDGALLSRGSVNADMLMGSAGSTRYLRILEAGLPEGTR
jgi:hypothetical protein